MHFEELWEKCEKFFQENNSSDEISSLIDELMMKINLYQILDQKPIPPEEKTKMKSLALGEILLVLSNISLKDNINVFESLYHALTLKSVNFYDQKYSG